MVSSLRIFKTIRFFFGDCFLLSAGLRHLYPAEHMKFSRDMLCGLHVKYCEKYRTSLFFRCGFGKRFISFGMFPALHKPVLLTRLLSEMPDMQGIVSISGIPEFAIFPAQDTGAVLPQASRFSRWNISCNSMIFIVGHRLPSNRIFPGKGVQPVSCQKRPCRPDIS